MTTHLQTSGKPPAIERARGLYLLRETVKPFEQELAEYLRYGYVVSFPDHFGMAKPVELENRGPAWFICVAVGRLDVIARMLPFHRPWVCFFRRFKQDQRLHIFAMDRMLARGLKP